MTCKTCINYLEYYLYLLTLVRRFLDNFVQDHKSFIIKIVELKKSISYKNGLCIPTTVNEHRNLEPGDILIQTNF